MNHPSRGLQPAEVEPGLLLARFQTRPAVATEAGGCSNVNCRAPNLPRPNLKPGALGIRSPPGRSTSECPRRPVPAASLALAAEWMASESKLAGQPWTPTCLCHSFKVRLVATSSDLLQQGYCCAQRVGLASSGWRSPIRARFDRRVEGAMSSSACRWRRRRPSKRTSATQRLRMERWRPVQSPAYAMLCSDCVRRVRTFGF